MGLQWPMTFTAVSPGGDYLAARPGHVPPVHQGVDINTGGKVGFPIYGSGAGVVTAVVNTGTTSGFGLYVQVQYGSLQVRTAHMSRADVRAGQAVSASTQLGLSGGFKGAFGAGDSNGPHCHCETHLNGALVNPHLYLPSPRTTTAGGGTTPVTPDAPPPPPAPPIGDMAMEIYEDGATTGVESGVFYAGAPGVWKKLTNTDFGGEAHVRDLLTAVNAKPIINLGTVDIGRVGALWLSMAPAAVTIDIPTLAKQISDELVAEGVGGITEVDLAAVLAKAIPTPAQYGAAARAAIVAPAPA